MQLHSLAPGACEGFHCTPHTALSVDSFSVKPACHAFPGWICSLLQTIELHEEFDACIMPERYRHIHVSQLCMLGHALL